MSRYPALIPLSVTAFLLSGCAVGPDYQAPSLSSLPSWWHSVTASPDKVTSGPTVQNPDGAEWWTHFNDPVLNALVLRAHASNHTLKIAQARITEARASYQGTASGLYPEVGITAQSQNSHQMLFGDESINQHQNRLVFDAVWEADLFGGTRRATEAAAATIQAKEADLHMAMITLTGDVVRNYIEWRQLQQQIALTQRTVKAQGTLVDIANQKYKAGTGSYLESAQATALLQNTQAQLPLLEQQRDAAGYRLSVLLGQAPGPLNDRLKDVRDLPRPIAVPTLNAPAEVVRNRPDVQAAERQLAASTALQGEALSALFPRISLSAFFGLNNSGLGDPTKTWGITPSAVAPLLNFGRIQSNIKAADARQQQAFHAYQNTVLQAIAEIETNLTGVTNDNNRVNLLRKAVNSSQQAVNIARDRYSNGLSTFTDVLQAEQQLYQAQNDLVRAQATLLVDLTALHKALAVAG